MQPQFYMYDLSISAPLHIYGDRFEENDARDFAAELTFPGSATGGTVMIEDLSFHDSGDWDFYELILPSLPSGTTQYDEIVTLYAEPDSTGIFTTFQITVFDASSSESFGRACTLENIREHFPDGRITFLVEDYMDHRNYYSLEIGYDRTESGVSSDPEFDLMVMPDWLENVMAVHPMDLPSNRLDGFPLPYEFPSAPETIAAISKGDAPTELPPETLVVRWEKTSDFVFDASYSGTESDVSISLINAFGDIVARGTESPFYLWKNAATVNIQADIINTIKVESLARGIYGLVIKSVIPFP